jgi:uncharacterized protein YneF (UPF0154 family)
MDFSGRARFIARYTALWAALGIAVLCIALAALGFLAAGLFCWLAQHSGVPAAAAITGGVLLALALLGGFGGSFWLRRQRRLHPAPPLLADLAGTAGLVMRLAGFIIRRDPKKAVLFSLLAGALMEFLSGNGETKS